MIVPVLTGAGDRSITYGHANPLGLEPHATGAPTFRGRVVGGS
jgi:hypothetical protein